MCLCIPSITHSLTTSLPHSLIHSLTHPIPPHPHTKTTISYNAIHDPTISMVAMSTQIEGALDVLRYVGGSNPIPIPIPIPIPTLGPC